VDAVDGLSVKSGFHDLGVSVIETQILPNASWCYFSSDEIGIFMCHLTQLDSHWFTYAIESSDERYQHFQ